MNEKHGHSLSEDLRVLERRLNRRDLLGFFAGAGLVRLVVACGGNSDPASSDAGTIGTGGTGGSGDGTGGSGGGATGSGGRATDTCAAIPDETGGPYPGDGTNGPNALTTGGIVRSDITTSFGAMTGVADGIPLTVKMTIVDVSAGCTPLANHAVYLWHCDGDGNYSLYTAPNENYLRGVTETDANGVATFTTIWPGCYSGRWPHIHFEIFQALANAVSGRSNIKTSQIALPKDASSAVYATSGYETSVRNLAQITLATDNVFSDGATLETPTVSGSVAEGYVIELTVGV